MTWFSWAHWIRWGVGFEGLERFDGVTARGSTGPTPPDLRMFAARLLQRRASWSPRLVVPMLMVGEPGAGKTMLRKALPFFRPRR